MTHRMTPALILIALTFSGLASAQTPAKRPPEPRIPDSVMVDQDVEYGRVNERILRLDVARPKKPSATPRPVIVFVHGGGWAGGDKSSFLPAAIRFAERDYVCFAIGYRLSKEAIWPAQIHDCKTALRWIRANASTYQLDPEKVAVFGHSAGGHLVSLLGTSGGVAPLEGTNGHLDQSSRVSCVVDLAGPSDFVTMARDNPENKIANGPKSAVAILLGGEVNDRLEIAREASPVTYVSSDDAPFLIAHGTKDELVPYSQAEELASALQKAKVAVTFVKMDGGGHGIGGKEIDQRIVGFIDKWLRGRDIVISSDPITVP